MTWITTNMTEGTLTSDYYNYTITGLSASTKYQYRAYFIIDGVEYYGNILTGATQAITLYNPTVTTGSVSGITTTSSFSIHNNNIIDIGGTPIFEYGILYTQQPITTDKTRLVYNNYPANIGKISIFSNISSVPYAYFMKITGLTQNTLTYYRAFAKNAKGIGYGTICEHRTAETLRYNLSINYPDARGGIKIMPTLPVYPAGTSITLKVFEDSIFEPYFEYWVYKDELYYDHEFTFIIYADTVIDAVFSPIPGPFDPNPNPDPFRI